MTTTDRSPSAVLGRERTVEHVARPRLAEHPGFAAASTAAIVALTLVNPRALAGRATPVATTGGSRPVAESAGPAR